MPKGQVTIPRLDLGMNLQDPPTSLLPGMLQRADNVRTDNGRLETAQGFTRITGSLLDDHTIILDGRNHFFHGAVDSTTTLAELATSDVDWTVEVVFRMDAIPNQSTTSGPRAAAIVHKGPSGTLGQSLASILPDWGFYVFSSTSTKKMDIGFLLSGASTTIHVVAESLAPDTIELGAWYHAACVYDTNVGQMQLYVHKLTDPLGSGVTGATTVGEAPLNEATDLWIGGIPNEEAVLTGSKETIYQFPGVVQELRIWSEARSTTDLEDYATRQLTAAEVSAATTLRYYQQLTGNPATKYWFRSLVGNTGSDTGEAPPLSAEPRSATWITASHPLQTAGRRPSIYLDGYTDALEIDAPYVYLQPSIGRDGSYTVNPILSITFHVFLHDLTEGNTVFHWVPATGSADWDSHLEDNVTDGKAATSGSFSTTVDSSMLLVDVIEKTAFSLPQLRFIWYDKAVATGAVTAHYVTSNVSGGVLANTGYTFTVIISSPVDPTAAKAISLLVDDSPTVITHGWSVASPGSNAITVPNDPGGAAVKYWMVWGRAVSRTRQITALAGDPNGLDVEYVTESNATGFTGSRSTRMELSNVIIASHANASYGPFTVHYMTVFNTHLTNKSVIRASSSSGTSLLSVWNFDASEGNEIEDLGLLSNPIQIKEDPDYVWGKSGITTNTKAQLEGIFEHDYVIPTGPVQKVLAVSGGSIYELNISLGAGTLTWLTDGFRNDDGNTVSTARFRDSTILCAGSGARGNFHMVKDQLFRLDIEPPTGLIPVGLEAQTDNEAALGRGKYRYAFTWFSDISGKRSPVGSVVEIEIKKSMANVAFGDVAEINQTYPSTPWSTNKEPYDFSGAVAMGPSGIRFWSWVGPDDDSKADTDPDWWENPPQKGATTTDRAKKKRMLVIRGSGSAAIEDATIGDAEEVTAAELTALVNARAKRVFTETDGKGNIRFRGVFAGPNAHLDIQDAGSTISVVDTSGIIDFADVFPLQANVSAPYSFTGTGDSNHGLTLPTTTDPQVTHLEIWRTVSGGSVFRLVARLQRGATGFVDRTADSALTGIPLDTAVGSPPATKYVVSYQGQAFYFGDEKSPERCYVSEPGEPWNTHVENIVDFLDGDSLALTGAAATEGVLFLFKKDTTFVISPSNSPDFPFTVQTRFADVGSMSHFGAANIHEHVYFPGEKGLFAFSGSAPTYLSEVIQPEWDNINRANAHKMTSISDKRGDSFLIAYPSGNLEIDDVVVNDRVLVLDRTIGKDPAGRTMGWVRRTNMNVRLFVVLCNENGDDRVFFLDDLGYIYQYDASDTYGPANLIASNNLAVTAGSPNTVTVAAAGGSLEDGYRGFFATLVRAADASRETRLILEDDLGSPSSVLTMSSDWDGAPPTSGDTLIIGSIEADAITGELSPQGPQNVALMTETFFRQDRQDTSATITLEWQGLGGVHGSHSAQDPAFSEINSAEITTFSNQEVDVVRATPARGRRFVHRFLSLGVNKPFAIRDMAITVIPHGQDGFR